MWLIFFSLWKVLTSGEKEDLFTGDRGLLNTTSLSLLGINMKTK